jgi:ABC-type sugar transport system permease subunit
MPAIVIVLLFLVLFLTAFLVVLLGPFVGLGLALWKNNKTTGPGPGRIPGNVARG